jgi:hypothetical protein
VVAAIAFHLVSVRVDGEDLVAARPQTLVDNVAPVALRLSRDAGNGDTLSRKSATSSRSSRPWKHLTQASLGAAPETV